MNWLRVIEAGPTPIKSFANVDGIIPIEDVVEDMALSMVVVVRPRKDTAG